MTLTSRELIELYLLHETRGNRTRYFKARQIAVSLGLTTKKVSGNLVILRRDSLRLVLKRNAFSTPTLWEVKRAEGRFLELDYTELRRARRHLEEVKTNDKI